MLVLNKAVKKVALFFIHLGVVVQSFLLSFIVTSPFINVTLLIISLVLKKLPENVNKNYWIVAVVCSIPLCILFTIIIETGLIKYRKGAENEPGSNK